MTTTSTTHTPGPWHVDKDGSIRAENDDEVLASHGDTEGHYLAATPEDRRLAAAAPDLLAALEAAHGYLVMMGTDHADHIRSVCRAAIFKAKVTKP